jgi:hypothetical protein
MANEDDKPRPVKINAPGYAKDRTNTLSISKDTAERLIARYLRDRGKMSPIDANSLASQICVGIQMAMPMPSRRGSEISESFPICCLTRIGRECLLPFAG